eukprot:759364-Hanusia_phi.AAC.7
MARPYQTYSIYWKRLRARRAEAKFLETTGPQLKPPGLLLLCSSSSMSDILWSCSKLCTIG